MGIPDIRFKDNKMVWTGDFSEDPDVRKQRTSVSYLFCNEGSMDYMPNFGQPIHLLLQNTITREAYKDLVSSKLFGVNLDDYNGFERLKDKQ